MRFLLTRFHRIHQATLGVLTMEGNKDFSLFTLEDDWKSNQQRVSCIPAGEYYCVPHGWEPDANLKFRRVWRLLDVPGRSGILFHGGNSIKDTSGCILLGTGSALGDKEARLVNSADGLDRMRRLVWDKSFWLTIRDVSGA
jgi:hypothetical protein